MFCRKCGKEIPEESNFCPNCGYNKTNEGYPSISRKFSVTKGFIIFHMICGVFMFFIPTIVGACALGQLGSVKKVEELTTVAILCIIFGCSIGGLLMFTLHDEDLRSI